MARRARRARGARTRRTPVVSRPTGVELSVESDKCSEGFSEVFTACAVVVHTQSVGTPFEHLIIDCVGPRPESGSGIELMRDWAEGLPWLLLAARAVVQESTGFGPSDLVFGHRVRTPLSVLGSELGGTEPPESMALT